MTTKTQIVILSVAKKTYTKPYLVKKGKIRNLTRGAGGSNTDGFNGNQPPS